MAASKLIPFKIHPRVFSALGADLVTSDVVAVIELVKNSYDAFASNVWIRFVVDDYGNDCIEIEDDGCGMTREIIEDVWSVVATPYKKNNPFTKSGEKKRRVSGDKGLGRLAVARIGKKLEMQTKADKEACLHVELDWSNISNAETLKGCYLSCEKFNGKTSFKTTGTLLRILNINSEWNEGMINDLKDNLSRLISPFNAKTDFAIHLSVPKFIPDGIIKIESLKFLKKPKYLLKGKADKNGNLSCTYRFLSFSDDSTRTTKCKLTWEQIYKALPKEKRLKDLNPNKAICGKFSFEIRAWDISTDDIEEIGENFGVKKTLIRKAIRTHKGISVYRDGILVLPKSENARDWLGLDLRRVSKVGTRLSTHQIVGYASISADENSEIGDTTDRERLVATREAKEFEAILESAVKTLENERDKDRVRLPVEKPLDDLFESLSATDLLAEVIAIAEEGIPASEAIPLLKEFNKNLDKTRKIIQERFIYYSRMATVGTIAQMLIHEIRNRTTIFGAFLKVVLKAHKELPKAIEKYLAQAVNAIDSLERLADTFAPLANRSFKRRRRQSNLKDNIEQCLVLHENDIAMLDIKIDVAKSTNVNIAVDPGELDAILLNLISNAIYWLSQVPKTKRTIEFKCVSISNGTRLRVKVDDSGPGIPSEDIERVMWPGVTRKPGGIGMGLTVASELVSEYGGRMTIKHPGILGGASFLFDLPIKK